MGMNRTATQRRLQPSTLRARRLSPAVDGSS